MNERYKCIIDKMRGDGHIEHHLRMRTELFIEDKSFVPGRVRVHLPVPVACRQLREGQLLDMEPLPRLVSVETYPQRTAYFEEMLRENRSFVLEHAFDNVLDYIVPDYDKAQEQQCFTWDEVSKPKSVTACGCHTYLGAEDTLLQEDLLQEGLLQPDDDDEAFAAGLRNNESNPLRRARAVYERITSLDKYAGRENLFFVVLCRRAFVPARWQGGLYAGPDAFSGGDIVVPGDWTEFYVQPYGFMFSDCHMGKQFYGAKDGLYEFYFTNIDPFRVPFASEYGANIYPAKEFPRINPYTNCYGEAEYDERGLTADEIRTVHSLLPSDPNKKDTDWREG